MLLLARERHCRLGDKACVVDGGTGSDQGRWRRVRASTMVGNDEVEAPGGLDDGAEALGRTRRRHRLWGGRRWCGLQGNLFIGEP
jgi:hypothetical protein